MLVVREEAGIRVFKAGGHHGTFELASMAIIIADTVQRLAQASSQHCIISCIDG